MNISKLTKVLMLGTICSLLGSCLDKGDESIVLTPQPEPPIGTTTNLITTTTGANISYNGFTLSVPKGAVPTKRDGQSGQVRFSITQAEELPAPLPSNCTPLSNKTTIKAEPMGFTFNSPLTLTLPTNGVDLNGLALLRFNEYTNSWESVPFSTINNNGTISVSTIELGYFVIVNYNNPPTFGGIRIQSRYLDNDYYYYVTLIPSSNSTSSKRMAFSANRQNLYMANLPLGEYHVEIARERKTSTLDQSQETQYCTYRPWVNVRNTLVPGNRGYDSYTGWTDIDLSGADWHNGRPSEWGTITATYGTGKLQATLTWVNGTSDGTDYDLHLFGPNVHVYYSNKNEGGFELDRDWLTEAGNAIENIYSVEDNILSGTYTIKVHHYSGQRGKRYNCRVIVNDVVIKSVSGAINSNNAFDEIVSFNL